MPHADLTRTAGRPPALPVAAAAYRQFPTAWRFALRNQTRNRLAGLLLVAFVPAWYLLMLAIVGHQPLSFRLYTTGQTLTVDGGKLTLISAGLNSLTLIVGFAIFAAVRRTLAFDKRLVFAGYRQATLITAKTLAIAIIAAGVALYAAAVLLAFWRPSPAGWLAILAAFGVLALTYGAFGLLLGVLVNNDLEGFFLIIMGGLMDTFLQNPLGNPLANKPVLEWFPSFGPMQFAVGGAFGHTALWSHLALGLAWSAAFAVTGLLIFRIRTRNRRHHSHLPVPR
jgi:ABC-2 type transport system permease protein